MPGSMPPLARAAFAFRGLIDRLQLPGTSRVVGALLEGADGEREVRLATGVRMKLDLADRVQRLYAFRAYERREMQLVRTALRPGDTFIDCGAHVGYYTLHAARAVGPSGAVHAFEPLPANALRVRENVELNGFGNARVVEAAVGEEPGRARFGAVEIPGESGWGSLLAEPAAHTLEIEVKMVALDDYVHEARVGPVRMMKLDVQGNELAALRGARALLERDGPDLLCEVDPYWLERAGTSARELYSYLKDLGYHPWTIRGGFRRREDPSALNVFFTRRER